MSTSNRIRKLSEYVNKLQEEETLIHYTPTLNKGEIEKRRFYYTPTALPTENLTLDERAKVDAYLRGFILGDKLNDSDDIKECTPFGKSGVHTMRVTFMSPQYRIFGGFLIKDCFIALGMWPRKGLNYKEKVQTTLQRWKELFPEEPTLKGKSFSDLITNGEERDGRKRNFKTNR
jgi:hypothetical protein